MDQVSYNLYKNLSVHGLTLSPYITVCIGCPSGWVCCGSAWGVCICTHPGWDSCCTRIPDPICIVANAACGVLKEPIIFILRGAEKIVDSSRFTLDIAKGFLSGAQGVVSAARATLDVVIAALDGVKSAYRVGVNALSALADFALTKIININEMYFNVALSAASGGRFACRVKGTLVGQSLDASFDFDTNDVLGIAKSIGERAVSGISNFIG